jgi:Eukaryotic-type carbonic anhydrase
VQGPPKLSVISQVACRSQLASVTVFLDASHDSPHYPMLDRLICQWRRFEASTRIACGLGAIETEYPGCFPNTSNGTARRHLRHSQFSREPRFQTFFDVLDHNARNPVSSRVNIEMDNENWKPAEKSNEEWEEWIHDQRNHRDLIENAHLNWFNYFLMLGVRTEYYFRYEGTQTIPPCYGPWTTGSRGNTTHWRVMKDPLRVHPHQIQEMKRLISNRIAAPWESEEFRCKLDTAANVSPTGNVNVARPVQSFSKAHAMTFW